MISGIFSQFILCLGILYFLKIGSKSGEKECQEHKRTYSHRQWFWLSDGSGLGVGRMFECPCFAIANSHGYYLSRTFPGLDVLGALWHFIFLTVLRVNRFTLFYM